MDEYKCEQVKQREKQLDQRKKIREALDRQLKEHEEMKKREKQDLIEFAKFEDTQVEEWKHHEEEEQVLYFFYVLISICFSLVLFESKC